MNFRSKGSKLSFRNCSSTSSIRLTHQMYSRPLRNKSLHFVGLALLRCDAEVAGGENDKLRKSRTALEV